MSSILILTNSGDATSDYLVGRLQHEAFDVFRLNSDGVGGAFDLTLGRDRRYVRVDGEKVDLDSIKTVIFRRPKPIRVKVDSDPAHNLHASKEWTEALEGFLAYIPLSNWINHPSSVFRASHKGHQLSLAETAGLSVPTWVLTSVPSEARRFISEVNEGVVVKTIASGYLERECGGRDSQIYTSRLNPKRAELVDCISATPVLFQAEVAKYADVRLTVIDGMFCAVSMRAQEANGNQRLDIRRDAMEDVEYSPIQVPQMVRIGVLQIMNAYKLRFACLDFVIDLHGAWHFLEVNPNGQWAWLDFDCDVDIAGMFVSAIGSK